MKRILPVIGFSFSVVLFCHCKSSQHISRTSEAIEFVSTLRRRGDDTGSVTPSIPQKAWRQNHFGITEITALAFVAGDSKGRVINFGYRFLDMDKKWAYEYTSLRDTAVLTRKYRYTDATKFEGGWPFVNADPIQVDSFHLLRDTIIHSIMYRQCKLHFQSGGYAFEGMGLLRCDKKGTVFQIDRGISDKAGCPLVALLKYRAQNATVELDQQIKFSDARFPDSVARAFSAWRKNEQANPVE